MDKNCKNNYGFRDGIKDGFPIVIGYLPIAMTFGILSKTTGISIIDSILFSMIVYAGASQFIALNLLSIGVGMGEIILTTLLVNFRHFLMSASLATKLNEDMKKWIPIIGFGVTDETFSVASFKEGKLTKEYILPLQLLAYISWASGTLLGYLVGGILPDSIEKSMEVALYAMFAAILVPEAKKSRKVVILACLSGIMNTILKYSLSLSQGWSIIISIILVSYLGLYLFKEEEVVSYE